jgi:hypothetical protein
VCVLPGAHRVCKLHVSFPGPFSTREDLSLSLSRSLSCSPGAKTQARLYVPDTLPGFVYMSHAYLSHGLVQEEGFADVLDLGDRALEVEGFGEDDLEDLGWRLE